MSFVRTIAQLVISDLIRVNDTINPIVRALRVSGLSYRYQDMRRDIGRALGWKHLYDRPAKPGGPLAFPQWESVENWEMPDGERYRIFGQSVWRDPVSGMMIQKQSSFYTDTLVEDATLEEEFGDLFGEDERYKELTFVAFERIGVERNPYMPQQMVQTR